jgi:uncharacterized membrane protein (UPF0182 family)
MKSWKTKLLVAAAALVGLVIAVGLLKLIFVDFVVDFWWFQSQGMTGYFVIRLIYRYLVFAFFAAIFFAFFYVNFWFASRVVGVDETSPDKNNKNLVKTLHNGLRRMYLPLSIMMALPIAVPMYLSWEKALLFLFGGASGATDPLIGKDISFYLFSLPVYTLIQKEVLVAFIILLVGVVFLYWYESRLLAIHDRALPRRARVHVSALALATVAIVCWGFLLERYHLLYESVNLPIFFGPGYVEMKIILPMIWLTVFFLAATGISVVVSVNRKAGWKVPLVFGLLFLVCVLGKNADFFNDMVRKYIVAPNQIARERPYIDANIRSTLAAFGLDAVQTQDFKTQSKPDFRRRRSCTGKAPAEHSRLGPRDAGRRLRGTPGHPDLLFVSDHRRGSLYRRGQLPPGIFRRQGDPVFQITRIRTELDQPSPAIHPRPGSGDDSGRPGR